MTCLGVKKTLMKDLTVSDVIWPNKQMVLIITNIIIFTALLTDTFKKIQKKLHPIQLQKWYTDWK